MKKALLATTLLLVFAATAGADILVQKSIGGVKLGATEAQVRSDRGAPNRTRTKHDDFSIVHVWTYDTLEVTFRQGAKVFEASAITTSSKQEQTGSGVGVGSDEASVKGGLPRVKCETIARVRSCHVGSLRAGRIVTDFLIKKGKVSRVTLGRVLD